MASKAARYVLGFLVALVLLAGAFSGGVIVGWALPANLKNPLALQLPTLQPVPGTAIQLTPLPISTAQADTTTLFKPFWQAWDLVHQQYVEQPVNDVEMMRGAIRGMLASLGDKYTSYMDPVQYEQQKAPLQGGYEGIGAWVDTTADYVTIIHPMPDSPALKAGLKTGDKIIAVDGQDMTGIDGSLVLRRILGPAGTKVSLTIKRDGQENPFSITIERARIVLPSIESKMLDQHIGYVRLNTFGDTTGADLRKALKTLMDQKPAGMVLDLRNNGGGYLQTAIEVVSEFVDKGVVMYEEYGDKTRRPFEAQGNGLATQVPLVVLVNQATASASEITAGAIQDYGRGKLVGIKTYGKGSVQNWIPLDDNQGAIRVTIARWLTPKLRQIHQIGLAPDVVVDLTEADLKAGKDPQLDKAVQVLLGK